MCAFSADLAMVFKKGLMYKGIYWPSLTNSFKCKRLEMAYLRYSHRQRQKSLIIVNIVDLLLKVTVLMSMNNLLKPFHLNFQIVLLVLWLAKNDTSKGEEVDPIIWTVCSMSANFAVCVLGWWKCFANNYLHWAAVCTWLLLSAQGK